MDSILTSIKKLLGIDENYEHFDIDLILHINSILTILNQMGVGQTQNFSIQDKTKTWIDFLGNDYNFELIKTYVYMKVRKAFDPPVTSAHMSSLDELIREYEFRIHIDADNKRLNKCLSH